METKEARFNTDDDSIYCYDWKPWGNFGQAWKLVEKVDDYISVMSEPRSLQDDTASVVRINETMVEPQPDDTCKALLVAVIQAHDVDLELSDYKKE